MQNEGVTAKAAFKDNLLELIVEASQIPNQQQSVAQIHKIINYLQLNFINKIKIYGKQRGNYSLGWYEEFEPFKVDCNSQEAV